MNYLLDTNALCELSKNKPNLGMLNWLAAAERSSLFLSVLSLGEISKGIERTNSQRRENIETWYESVMHSWFEDRILSIDNITAINWGKLTGGHYRTLPAIDALIAATAMTHDLTLVTRNIKDFKNIEGLKVLNPFSPL